MEGLPAQPSLLLAFLRRGLRIRRLWTQERRRSRSRLLVGFWLLLFAASTASTFGHLNLLMLRRVLLGAVGKGMTTGGNILAGTSRGLTGTQHRRESDQGQKSQKQ